MVSSQVVRTVVDLLDDPFVRELQDAVGAPTNSLYDAVRNASRYGTADDILTLSRVLTDTRRRLIASANHVEDDPDGVILRAELELMLDDVAMLLEPPPQSEQGKRERDVVQR
jgi:hypothetical protein